MGIIIGWFSSMSHSIYGDEPHSFIVWFLMIMSGGRPGDH